MTDYQCITCGWKGTNPRHMTDGAAHYSWWKCPKCGKEGDIYTSEFLHRIFMFHYSDFLPRYTETLQSLTKYLEVDQYFFGTLLKDQGVVCLIPKSKIRELIMRAGRMRQVILGILGIEKVEDRTTDETTTTFVEETQEGHRIREEQEKAVKELYDAQKEAKTLGEQIASELHKDIKRLFRSESLKPKTYKITGEITIEEKHERDR